MVGCEEAIIVQSEITLAFNNVEAMCDTGGGDARVVDGEDLSHIEPTGHGN